MRDIRAHTSWIGSYPEDKMKCYRTKKRNTSEQKDTEGQHDDESDDDDDHGGGVPLGRRKYDPRAVEAEEEGDTGGTVTVTNVLHNAA